MYCTTFQKRLFYGISVGLCCCLILAGGLLCGLNMNNEKSLEFLFGTGLLFTAFVAGCIFTCVCCCIRNGDREMAQYTHV